MTNIIRFTRVYSEEQLALEYAHTKLYGNCGGEVIEFAPYLERKRQIERCLYQRTLRGLLGS